ncbi:MAG: hypothetical protein HY289_00675 [Planctomycetes bacterium]|nr:hypothetical protein [Planctomycetota bacterium]
MTVSNANNSMSAPRTPQEIREQLADLRKVKAEALAYGEKDFAGKMALQSIRAQEELLEDELREADLMDVPLRKSWQALSDGELALRRIELEIRNREVELPIELARLGLRGTLMGALAGAAILVILAIISAYSERAQITGTHICILAGIICATVVFYGAFVFQRSIQIAVDKTKGVTASTTDQRPIETSTKH